MQTDDDIEYGLDGQPLVGQPAPTPPESELDHTPFDDTPSDVEEPPTVDDVMEAQTQMQAVHVAMEALCDLHYTISVMGVSQADMQRYRDTAAGLVEQGVVVPSLESFTTGLYTEDRSEINLTVATESILKTVGNAIRVLITKIIEYINKFVRWVRSVLQSEDTQRRKLDNAIRRVNAVRAKSDEFIALYDVPDDYDKLLRETAKALLDDPKYQPTAVHTALLGLASTAEKAAVEAPLSGLDEIVPAIPALAQELRTFLQSPTDNGLDDMDRAAFLNLAMNVEAIAQTRVENRSGRYSDTHPRPFDLPLHKGQFITEFTPSRYIMEAFEATTDHLKKIRSVAIDSAYVENVNRMIVALSKATEGLSSVFQYAYGLNVERVAMLNRFYQYENVKFGILYRHAQSRGIEERVLKPIKDALAKVIKDTMN